jgi:adenine-specific DNA-methyltransferase
MIGLLLMVNFLKIKSIELALAMDVGLIKLLLKNNSIKKHFFTEVAGVYSVLVFDKIKFQKFVSNKEFLPDSYTSFKNKIGLVNDRGEYLDDGREVVLVWPYKDCVLEGGQTKEDQKRDEIFWNETLAPDEIDRLLAPKVLTGWKRYDSKGAHELTGKDKIDFKNENLIIRGNNLLALHSIYKKYAGKVKLIYIDPPYNTGSDDFNYNDSFNHSTWLTFMKNRLNIARDLLRDDGCIFIQIDFNEQAYLKVLCDSVFGHDNFVNQIVWKRRGGKTSPDTNRLENVYDFILMYSKTQNYEIKFLYTKEDSEDYIEEQFKYYDENKRRYRLSPLNAPQYRPTLVYDFMGYKPHPNGWSVKKERLQKMYEEGRLVFPKGKNGRVNRKQYLDEWEGYAINALWTDIKSISGSSKERTELMRGQKPETLIQRFIELSTKPNEIVLDFFLGSGTTCAVAHKMERQYIGIEQLDYGKKDFISRLKDVIKGNATGISKAVKWQGGGSFIYCELSEWNEAYVSKIQKTKTTKELLTLWAEIQGKAFISYKVDPKSINSNISEFKELSLEDQKRFLIEILDKNQLYVNYSEIDDKDYQVSETDKKINRMFYGEV